MLHHFEVKAAPVLRFTTQPDRQDMVIPPSCHATFVKTVPVSFNANERTPVGSANLYRKGNVLYADMLLSSSMPNPDDALKGIQGLIPSISFYIRDAHQQTVTAIEILGISLGWANADPGILPLGERVSIRSRGNLS